jgi:uncharacterized protein YcbX
LAYYPIKGCGGITVDHTEVTMTGLPDDRLFAVVGMDGAIVWQGAVPRDDLTVDVIPDGPVRSVDVDKWPGAGIDQGDDVATWLSDLLAKPVRLVREPARAARARHPDPTALLIISESSLDCLNSRIERRDATPVPMSRFRPNLVITAWPDPHTEDRVHRMTIGATVIGFGELAIRCAVTTIDQTTGTRRGPEPLRTLADYRREPDGVSFGLKATVLTPGRIAIHDPVTVTAWR